MTFRILFASLVLSIGLFSCDEEPVTMIYDQTKCADPWGMGENVPNVNTAQAVTLYFFDTHGVILDNVDLVFETGFAQACEACICTTGNRIRVTLADEDDVAVLEDEGFVEL